MMRKIAVVSFLVFLNISVAGDQLDEQKIFDSFKQYTEKVYLKNFNRDRLQIAGLFGNLDQLSVRVLGYSLGNLLRYARRGEKNHKTWLILERKLKEGIFAETEEFGKQNGQDQAWIEKRQKRFWDECVAA